MTYLYPYESLQSYLLKIVCKRLEQLLKFFFKEYADVLMMTCMNMVKNLVSSFIAYVRTNEDEQNIFTCIY